MSRNSILLIFLPNQLKNVKSILSSQAIEQAVDLGLEFIVISASTLNELLEVGFISYLE